MAAKLKSIQALIELCLSFVCFFLDCIKVPGFKSFNCFRFIVVSLISWFLSTVQHF